MLTLLRNLHAQPTGRWAVAASSRHFSSSFPRFARAAEEESEGADEEEANASSRDVKTRKGRIRGFADWLERGEGKRFKNPHQPRNWLGGEVPFPLNPSFKPPTPVSDRLRTLIWEQFVANPSANGVRQLAERYGLSIKRVDAILRLKGLEQHWMKKKPLQTGFVLGMEKILGAKDVRARMGMPEGSETLGEDTTIADSDYDAFGNDEARHRYQRLFWEPHAENTSPVLPRLLERARAASERHKLVDQVNKSDPELLGEDISEDHELGTSFVVERGNRPAVKFVDVGGKFLDVKDRRRRMQEGERRSKLRTKRRLRKLQSLEAGKQAA
ncbi:hypothetical protein NM688_g1876 [Phlebia brevispora]|uniref:Uncharacterized protein n=1 Tax=Phlebia brevispora TaxID=194682 RepID=A0ACC1TAC8_9APHY|nr:hypothetical protein NM688_g1876 [Phlebia brevispora]